MSTALSHWRRQVSDAALALESRWTMNALRRVDAELARRLHEQIGLFDQACITGGDDEIALHGAATCRGYSAAVAALGNEPDDAYLIGEDPATGFRVAIGDQRAAADRVRELHGSSVVWVTPDEVAKVMASVEQFKAIAVVKQFFPGAAMIDRFPSEPSEAA